MGNLVEAVDARDLLDQVGLALHVGVPPPRYTPESSIALFEAEPLEDLAHPLGRIRSPSRRSIRP